MSEDVLEPVEISEDPGRPDGIIDGAPGAMLVIISGPSGVGKDTIIDAMRERTHEPEYHYVVTCTTRVPRPGEIDGVGWWAKFTKIELPLIMGSIYLLLVFVIIDTIKDAGMILALAGMQGGPGGVAMLDDDRAAHVEHMVILKKALEDAKFDQKRVQVEVRRSVDEARKAMEEAIRSRRPTLINAVIDEKAGTESGRITALNPTAKKK